ncbi:MAG: FtsQ-type POTRA domain-containing protein [Proteobacteria bacterium]|nr:FtsQ-type POTRA domain-containing protein [Desulfobacula sp.]MBU4133134.1 FtsQ-type POTRA domain-containing protein [Pseudomonadota bacterium]
MKQNKYKPEPSSPKGKNAGPNLLEKNGLKICVTVGLVILMSLSAIWVHDAITQCPFFTIKQVDISGALRVEKKEIIQLAGLTEQANLFQINLNIIEQQLVSHPWIERASVKRSFFSTLVVAIVEEEPLAIVNIENLADIIINTQGQPFKEYDPQKDQLNFLPVISGVDLTQAGTTYQFEGLLFNSIMDLLKLQGFGRISKIMGDENIGITIQSQDIYNRNPVNTQTIMPIKLGFNQFEEKRIKAIKISTYIDKNFPDKSICAMDLYNIEKIFITTKETDALHHTLEKGV